MVNKNPHRNSSFHKDLSCQYRPFRLPLSQTRQAYPDDILVAVGLYLKQWFPPRRDIGPERTPEGAKRQRSTRSEVESCADGLSWHNDPAEGNYIKSISAGMERSGME